MNGDKDGNLVNENIVELKRGLLPLNSIDKYIITPESYCGRRNAELEFKYFTKVYTI